MVSAHARESDLLARRIAQAGIDYVFEKYEVEQDPETFVRAVMSPDSFSPKRENIDWSAHGYLAEPDVSHAVTTLESSPAGTMLLTDEPHKRHKDLEWAIRKLRKDLDRWLPRRDVSTSPRHSDGPSKKWLAQQFRQIFGRDLPVDPE